MNYQHPDGTFGQRLVSRVNWQPMWERIRELVADKQSAQEIANLIGVEFRIRTTRNAVIGQVHRHKLGQLASPSPQNTAASRVPRVRVRKYIPKPKVEAPIAADIEDSKIPFEQRCTLLQLTKDTCKFPVGDPTSEDFFFCGGQTLADAPYCAGHCRRAFNYEAKTTRFNRVLAKREK